MDKAPKKVVSRRSPRTKLALAAQEEEKELTEDDLIVMRARIWLSEIVVKLSKDENKPSNHGRKFDKDVVGEDTNNAGVGYGANAKDGRDRNEETQRHGCEERQEERVDDESETIQATRRRKTATRTTVASATTRSANKVGGSGESECAWDEWIFFHGNERRNTARRYNSRIAFATSHPAITTRWSA